MGQYIFGRMDPQHTFSVEQKLVKAGLSKAIDNVSQGYAPTQEGTGVLYSWKNTPLAYVDIPTLNHMIFSRALWEGLLKNEFLKFALEGRSHWMGACHQDKDEITFPEIAGRVTNLWIDNDLVMGDIDIMDTTNGLNIYKCAKTGRVCNSSRGFGELRDRRDGLKEVVPEQYAHVSWDFVTFPAVNRCIMTMADDITSTTEVDNLSDYLRSLVCEAYERNPGDPALQKLFASAGGLRKKSFVIDAKFRRDLGDALFCHNLRRSLVVSAKSGFVAYHGTTHIINQFKCSQAEGGGGGGLGWAGYGISFAKGVNMAYRYSDGVRIYKVLLNASRDCFIRMGLYMKKQSAIVINAAKTIFKASEDLMEETGEDFLDILSGGYVSKTVALKFVKAGVVGAEDSVTFQVWNDTIVQIIGVAELNGLGVMKPRNNFERREGIWEILEYWVNNIRSGQNTLEEAVDHLVRSGASELAESLKARASELGPLKIDFTPIG